MFGLGNSVRRGLVGGEREEGRTKVKNNLRTIFSSEQVVNFSLEL
jgi:hypothetical protein